MPLLDKLTHNVSDDGELVGVEIFFAALWEFAYGNINRAGVVNYFNLDAADEVELDYLISSYSAQPTAELKRIWLHRVERIFHAAVDRAPGYLTVQEVKNKIDAI